jgi:hypothetical protein
MRFKLSLLIILISLISMNTYSRVLQHINMNDVKQKHQQKLIEQKIQEEKIKEEEKYIASVMEEKKYDWRKKLNEGMTSSGTFFSTLPATGDSDLFALNISDPVNYQGYSNVLHGDGLSFKTYGVNPYALTNVIDTTYSDTISFTGYANPDFSTQSDLYLFWYNNDTDEYGDMVAISKNSTSSSVYNINLPPEARGPRVDFEFYQLRSYLDAIADFDGKPLYIDGQLIEINPNFSSSLGTMIYSLLVNYNNPATTRVDLGRGIMAYASQNPSRVSGYEDTQGDPFYPGFPGPVSGNIGDPRVDGINGALYGLKNNGWDIEFINILYGTAAYTQQELIDLFYDTSLNGAQLYNDLSEWERLTDLATGYYDQYSNYFQQNDIPNANYYLNLYFVNRALATDRENAVLGAIGAAETFPDSEWTDEDYEKVAEDVYNTYGNSTTYTISNLSTKRTTPMNVFVALDDPAATSFIRTDPMMTNLSPQERLKKLKEMLESGDEYVRKMFGDEFPGSGAVLPGKAGDTPGVEIAGYGLRPDGTSGMNNVGDKIYDPHTKKQYELVPSPKYGGGTEWQPVKQASDSSQDIQIAQALPIEPAQQRRGATGVGVPDTKELPGPRPAMPGTMNYPPEWTQWKNASTKDKNKVQIAHYEPEGQVISEKKLKSPQEVLNKIPGYYDGKPAPLGFPVEPPPKMVNGMHPDLVDGKKVADRFNRLDPESAKAMPPTGNPHIDKKVEAARKKPK